MHDTLIERSHILWERVAARPREYFALTKPTITLLVVVTALPGLLMQAPGTLSLRFVAVVLLGTALCSASAAAFNQILERRLDQAMKRTAHRGVASGRVDTLEASIFGLILLSLGLGLLGKGAHPLAAWVALAGHLFYVFVYTAFLKPRTPQNIVIGGAAGAVGPLIGSAAFGSISLSAWLLFAIIFLWTPPHFWALALRYREDYAAAGIPMYPNIYGDQKTRQAMFLYSLSLFVPVVLLGVCGAVSMMYLAFALLLTAKLSWDAWELMRSGSNKRAMEYFLYTCAYTFALFLGLSLDCLLFGSSIS